MPLEISEIGVRVAVGEAPALASDPAAEDQPAALTEAQLQDIIAACVRDVLRTLRMQGDR
jgi:hypothetical protein